MLEHNNLSDFEQVSLPLLACHFCSVREGWCQVLTPSGSIQHAWAFPEEGLVSVWDLKV